MLASLGEERNSGNYYQCIPITPEFAAKITQNK